MTIKNDSIRAIWIEKDQIKICFEPTVGKDITFSISCPDLEGTLSKLHEHWKNRYDLIFGD